MEQRILLPAEPMLPSELWAAAIGCPCGLDSCALQDTGYLWCTRCRDHHRHPETCHGITEDGVDAD